MIDGENPFSRWSERKRRVAKEEAVEEKTPPAAEPVAAPETEMEESELLEKLGLPVPETLSEGDDFSAFMKAGVPDFLRKRALRVLWRSNPVLANLDGLNDYDDDFRSPELTQKVLATAYKVGRGILSDPKPETEASEVDHVAADDTFPESVEAEAEVAANDTSGLPDGRESTGIVVPQMEDDAEPAVRPRRMRFETKS